MEAERKNFADGIGKILCLNHLILCGLPSENAWPLPIPRELAGFCFRQKNSVSSPIMKRFGTAVFLFLNSHLFAC